jgi:hypothetical protein
MEKVTPIQVVKEMISEALRDGKIKIWEDPGHGWLQVPLDIIKRMKKDCGLKVSGFSYKDKENAYLEEDLDMGNFINIGVGLNEFKYWRQSGQVITEHKENIFIRNLTRF